MEFFGKRAQRNRSLYTSTKKAFITLDYRGKNYVACQLSNPKLRLLSFWQYLSLVYRILSFDRLQQVVFELKILILQCFCPAFMR